MKLNLTSGALTLLFLTLGFSSQSAFALSPPWFVLQAQFKATLEADSCLLVDSLVESSPGQFELSIHDLCGSSKAKALSPFLSKVHPFSGGQINVTVHVFDSNGNLEPHGTVPTDPKQAEKLLRIGLKGNRFFVKILKGNSPFTPFNLYIVFTADIIQYFSDDISDFFSNTNQVAAQAFREVLGLTSIRGILISATTEPLQGPTSTRISHLPPVYP